MLYMNNPEALLAITEERRAELGQRSTSGPNAAPFDAAFGERSRPRSVDHRFRNQMA